MDLARMERLRDELLQDRRWMIIAGVCAVVFCLATLVAGYYLVRHTMQEGRVVTRTTSPPTQVRLLLDESMGNLLNYIVYFNDVRLEGGPSEDVYFVTGASGGRMLVISKGSKTAREADSVDVKGTVRPVPSAATLKKWKLSNDQIKAVRDQGIFIEADEISARRSTSQRVARK
jgi:hypothetical protein